MIKSYITGTVGLIATGALTIGLFIFLVIYDKPPYEKPYRIRLFDCSGKMTQEWTSTGYPQSDGSKTYFTDQLTGKDNIVSGSWTAEEIK